MAPPNHGSPIPSFLGKYKIFRKWLGPAFCQLADIEALPLTNYAARLGIIPVATTILIGTRNLDFYFAPLFREQNDGKVSHKSAQGIGEEKCITGLWSHMNIIKQFVVLKYIHSIIKQSTTNSKKAINTQIKLELGSRVYLEVVC